MHPTIHWWLKSEQDKIQIMTEFEMKWFKKTKANDYNVQKKWLGFEGLLNDLGGVTK